MILVLVPAIGFGGPAAAEKRVALVIGNSAYEAVEKLANPVNDAVAIVESLERLGFDSIIFKKDLDYRAFRRTLSEFSRLADGADVAIIFYAGHGIEVSRRNYLIPVDAALQSARDVDLEALPLDVVMTTLEGAKKLRLVVLDACRDNPYRSRMTRRNSTRSVGRGLARVETPSNTLVAYAAREGTTADDGSGEHSPFTTALLQHLESPGLEINFLFRRVRDSVLQATGGRQEPFLYGSLSSDEIYLKPPSDPKATAGSPIAQSATPESPARRAWSDVKASKSEAVLKAFIKQFPTGIYSELAKARLKELSETKVAVGVYPEKPKPKAVPIFVPAEANDYRLTTKRGVKIHAEAREDARLLGTILKRRFVRLAGTVQGAGWSKIEWSAGQSGYVRSSFIGEAIKDPHQVSGLAEFVDKSGDWIGSLLFFRSHLEKHIRNANSGYGQLQKYAGIYRAGWDSSACDTGYRNVSGEGFLGPGFWSRLTTVVWSEGGKLMWAHPGYKDHAVYKMGSPGKTINLQGGKGNFRTRRAFHTTNKKTEWFGFNSSQLFISTDNSSFNSLYKCENADLDGRTVKAVNRGLSYYLSQQSDILAEPLLSYKSGEHGSRVEAGFEWDRVDLSKNRPKDLSGTLAPTHAFRVASLKPFSAAAKGGLRKDDLIYAVDSRTPSETDGLSKWSEKWSDGQTVALSVWRDGKSIDLSIVVPSRYSRFQEIVKSARGGDAEAAYLAGRLISGWEKIVEPGDGESYSASKNWKSSQSGAWYYKGAASGNVEAMVALADLYDGSEPEFAIEWYRKAIAAGNTDAMHGLGDMYAKGKGFPAKSPEEAANWYKKAAAAGRIDSMTSLAKMFSEGKGVPKKPNESAHWYRKAAEAGDVESMVTIAALLEQGTGIGKNLADAKSWYERAAAKENSDAEYALGKMYLEGRGVQKDPGEASRWFEKAKDGNWDALGALSTMYDKGQGVERDAEKAARLFFDRIKRAWSFDDDDVKKYFTDRTAGWSVATKRAFQQQLKDAGVYQGGIDGVFGGGTRAAVKQLSK